LAARKELASHVSSDWSPTTEGVSCTVLHAI
jgi:hypothetical protein